MIKEAELKRLSTVIYERADAIFLSLAFIVVMMMVMMTFMMVVVFLIMILVCMMMLVLILLLVVILVVMLELSYPSGRGSNLVEIEHACVHNLIEVNITIVALQNLSLGLEGTDNLTDTTQFFGSHLCSLVEQDNVAELYLLDYEVLDVLFVDIVSHKIVAAAKLIAHTQRIDNRHDTIKHRGSSFRITGIQLRDGANGLSNGSRLTDTACLDNNIVETMHGNDIVQLLDEIHLQGAADATVLKSHKAIVALTNDAALLNQIGIDVNLTNIIYNNSKLDTFPIGKYTVEKCSLTAAQITREQQNGSIYLIHIL